MKKNGKWNYFIGAGLLLNTANTIASRFLPVALPDAVHIVISLIAIGLIVVGIVTSPTVRNSRFRQAKLRIIRKVFGRE